MAFVFSIFKGERRVDIIDVCLMRINKELKKLVDLTVYVTDWIESHTRNNNNLKTCGEGALNFFEMI